MPKLPPFLEPYPGLLDRITTVYADGTCQLPPCELVVESRVYSERCGTRGTDRVKWPLLITSTPRSATVYAQSTLREMGMQIQDDWYRAMRDGRVSWIHVFEDPDNFGRARIPPREKFRRVLHQVKEPLEAMASMCGEPVYRYPTYVAFLGRHIDVENFTHLGWWVQWHEFITLMRFPTYQVENVDFRDIFEVSNMKHLYKERQDNSSAKSNHRGHRPTFTWQELYTIDPQFAAKAWRLAHFYGYTYPDVDFDSLTCLGYTPSCNHIRRDPASSTCPPGTHPYPTNMSDMIISPAADLGLSGWVDRGCVEHKVGTPDNVTYIGLPGLISPEDLRKINATVGASVALQLRDYVITRNRSSVDRNASLPENWLRVETQHDLPDGGSIFCVAVLVAAAVRFIFRDIMSPSQRTILAFIFLSVVMLLAG